MLMHVHAGTDTYGRVKVVAGTGIVTKIFMFQALPIVPLRSYYFLRSGPTTKSGVPFFASSQETSIVGLPLARLDLASVLMTYARAFFATLILIGSLVIMTCVTYFTGNHIDDRMMLITRVLLAMLATGVVGGLLTYAIPLTSRRDREIRGYCAELLGVSADPARVTAEARGWIIGWIEGAGRPADDPRPSKIRQLIATRLELAESDEPRRLQDRTDDLLEQLRAEELSSPGLAT